MLDISCLAEFDALGWVGAKFGKGDATKHFSLERKGFFSVKRGRHSVTEGFGRDFYRKGSSVKRSRPVSEPPDSEN